MKFDIPSAPAGKELVSARLRVFFSGKTGSFGDEEQVVLLYSNDDNDGYVTIDDYQDNTYDFLAAYDPEEDDVNLNAIVSGGKDTGAWYEREVYAAVKNDGSGRSAFRLELYDHTYRTSTKVFVFSTTNSPQLVLSYARVPTVAGTYDPVEITVDPDTVLRDGLNDPLLTGWNINWFGFQGGWQMSDPTCALFDIDPNSQTVFPEVLKALKRIPGCVYRYPGGSVSQHGYWENTVGDLEDRDPQEHNAAGNTAIPYYGFNEFMQMVEDVHGVPVIVVNIGTGTAQQAADWVEYANAPNDSSNPGGGTDWAAHRAADGHPAPYNIRYWEIGNETDSAFDFTPTDYVGKVDAFAAAMTAIDPSISLIPHTRTYYAPPDSCGEFDIPVVDHLGSNWGSYVAGMAHHYYFLWGALGGDLFMELTAQAGEMEWFIGDGKRLFITENATWGDANVGYGDWHTSGWEGAIGLAAYYNAISQLPVVKMGLIHVLSGTGWWPAFYYNSSVEERLPMPTALSHQLVNISFKGDTLKTLVDGPDRVGRNNSSRGDYNVDVSASAFQDSEEKRLLLTNFSWVNYASEITWPGLPQGDMDVEQVVLRRYGVSSSNPIYPAVLTHVPSSTLDGAIDDSVSTISLDRTFGFSDPDDAYTAYVQIDAETIGYTDVNGLDLESCTRGANGSTAAAHDDEAKVTSATEEDWVPYAAVEYTSTTTVSVDSNGTFSLTIPKYSVVAVKLGAESNVLLNGDFSGSMSNWANNSSDDHVPAFPATNTVNGNHLSGDATKLQLDQHGKAGVPTGYNSALSSSGSVGQHYDDFFLLTGTIRARGCDSGRGGRILAHINKNSGAWTAAVPTERITDTCDWARVGKIFSPVEHIDNGDTFHSVRVSLDGDSTNGGDVDFDEIALIRLNNLIVNGGFDSSCASWGNWGTPVQQVDTDAKVGDGCVKLSGAGGSWAFQGNSQNSRLGGSFVTTRASDQFRLRGFVKASSNLTGYGARISVYVYEEPVGGGTVSLAGMILGELEKGTEWTLKTLDFTPSEVISPDCQLSSLGVFLSIASNDGAGHACFDAINLIHMGRDPE